MHNDPMSWRANEKRWTKWYNGKIYNVSPRQLVKAGLIDKGTPPTKEATRTAMRAWWKAKEDELQSKEVCEPQPVRGITLTGIGQDYTDEGTLEKIRLRINQKIGEQNAQDGKIDLRAIEEHVKDLIADARRKLNRLQETTPAEQSIGPNVEAFLAFKKSQADAGERSLGRVDCLRLHLDHFQGWNGAEKPVAEIGAVVVRQYYEHVLGEARKGTYSRYYARDLFASFRQFVRWLTEQDVIPVPKNLMSKEFGFKLGTKIKTFSDDELKLLLHEATERTKLYMLLALNTGATQIDIAELPKSCLDLTNGWLTRKRYKTADHDHVPEVVYKLWEPTVALLKKHVNKDDKMVNRHGEPLALVSMDGKPLVHKSYNKKGYLTKTDAVRNAYNRTAEKLKNHGTTIEGSFKHFRKTAASKLEEHDTYGRYVVHFLGQSPRTVAGRHYVTPSQEQFTAAVEWLRTQFLSITKK